MHAQPGFLLYSDSLFRGPLCICVYLIVIMWPRSPYAGLGASQASGWICYNEGRTEERLGGTRRVGEHLRQWNTDDASCYRCFCSASADSSACSNQPSGIPSLCETRFVLMPEVCDPLHPLSTLFTVPLRAVWLWCNPAEGSFFGKTGHEFWSIHSFG